MNETGTKRQYREVDGVIYCDRVGCPGSTGLRCYRTNVPICQKCSVRTPVGYLSKDAAREQQNLFFNADISDYMIAGAAAFFANLMVGFIATRVAMLLAFGFFGLLIMVFVGASAASLISEIIWRALRKKRGRYTSEVSVAAILVSSALLLPITSPLVLVIYAGVVATAVSARFRLGLRV